LEFAIFQRRFSLSNYRFEMVDFRAIDWGFSIFERSIFEQEISMSIIDLGFGIFDIRAIDFQLSVVDCQF
jgi:hypothetical protein